jgi:hypothetical protein
LDPPQKRKGVAPKKARAKAAAAGGIFNFGWSVDSAEKESRLTRKGRFSAFGRETTLYTLFSAVHVTTDRAPIGLFGGLAQGFLSLCAGRMAQRS